MGFVLFIIAYVLILPFTVTNYFYVDNKKGYFKSTARNLDIFANREFRTLWNTVLIQKDGYQFGVEGETLSSAIGKNQLYGNLKPKGKWLVKKLDKIEKDHCLNAIDWNFGK